MREFWKSTFNTRSAKHFWGSQFTGEISRRAGYSWNICKLSWHQLQFPPWGISGLPLLKMHQVQAFTFTLYPWRLLLGLGWGNAKGNDRGHQKGCISWGLAFYKIIRPRVVVFLVSQVPYTLTRMMNNILLSCYRDIYSKTNLSTMKFLGLLVCLFIWNHSFILDLCIMIKFTMTIA